LVSLIAIFGGIQLFGILGVFIGPVLAGILKSLLQIWPVIGRRFGVLQQIPVE
jgi:predicted PurR-regulated permease PerM